MQAIAATPIATAYKGNLFRSRTESRWAVFFDSIGEPWQYEPEGFRLAAGHYLPDFWLPRLSTWCEVKPEAPEFGSREGRLCEQLGAATGKRVIVLCGAPREYDFASSDSPLAVQFAPHWDSPHAPCICPVCGAFGIEFEGRGARACGNRCCPDSDRLHTGWHLRIKQAVEAAQTFRFWDPVD